MIDIAEEVQTFKFIILQNKDKLVQGFSIELVEETPSVFHLLIIQ